MLSVAVGGLGGIGAAVVRALDAGIAGLELSAVSARDPVKARHVLDGLRTEPSFVTPEELAGLAAVVVECLPANVYDRIARPAVEQGRIFVTMSSGALLNRPELFTLAAETGGRIIVPSGGILGFDGIRAAAEGDIQSVTLITRKPPQSFAGAAYLEANSLSLEGLGAPFRLFKGSARDAAAAFPANANVAASLSLATLGPERTRVEIWADPGISTLNQEVRIVADSCSVTIKIESYPLVENPRTGSLTPKSVISTLRGLVAVTRIGT